MTGIARTRLVAIGVRPVVDLPARFVLRAAILLLDLAHQLVALAADRVELVVGELAPLLLHLPAELLPIALDAIPVHGDSLQTFAILVGPPWVRTFPTCADATSGCGNGAFHQRRPGRRALHAARDARH